MNVSCCSSPHSTVQYVICLLRFKKWKLLHFLLWCATYRLASQWSIRAALWHCLCTKNFTPLPSIHARNMPRCLTCAHATKETHPTHISYSYAQMDYLKRDAVHTGANVSMDADYIMSRAKVSKRTNQQITATSYDHHTCLRCALQTAHFILQVLHERCSGLVCT